MEILNVESREEGEYFLACELNAKRVKLAQPILLKLLTHSHTTTKNTLVYIFKEGPGKWKFLFVFSFAITATLLLLRSCYK